MCIVSCKKTPYNKTKIRWKILHRDVLRRDGLQSLFYGFSWDVNKNYQTKRDPYNIDVGFHVFITKIQAKIQAKNIIETEGYSKQDFVIAKVIVDNFSRSGYWQDKEPGYECEVWQQAKVVQVFTASGRHDITYKFLKNAKNSSNRNSRKRQ